jgi:RNA polymerase sigma-54 factor
MALDLRQTQSLSQQLVITQQLQQAIKLLQLNHLELMEVVQQEMLENPTLEEVPGTSSEVVSDAEQRLVDGASRQQQDVVDQNNGREEGKVDWEQVLEDYSSSSAFKTGSGAGDFGDMPPIEASLRSTESLTAHLEWQLGMLPIDARLKAACVAIIGNLDDHGWLEAPLEDLAEAEAVPLEHLREAQAVVQALDPIGCGSEGLIDCLTYQARFYWPEDPFIQVILTDHISSLEIRNYGAIARALSMEVEDVVEYHKMIQTLEPWPGRQYSDGPSQYITPDITVVKMGGEWQILQNEDGLPRLRVSPYYRRVLKDKGSSKDEKQYIKERLDSADFLIRSIYKRQRTIHKVMECILDRQREFFDLGAEALKPMVLRDVADEIGVHESTVSRVTTNKYVQCAHGILELKYFFNAGISRAHGDDLAGEAVKEKIRRLVSDEDPKDPLSDSAIVDLLRDQDVIIARRTVAKYRDQMGILPSTQRKRMF